MKNLLSSKSLSIFYDSQRKHFTYLDYVKSVLLHYLGLFSTALSQAFGNKSSKYKHRHLQRQYFQLLLTHSNQSAFSLL